MGQPYTWTDAGEPHLMRRKQMLAKYGDEIKKLYGYDNSTAYWAFSAACLHVFISFWVRDWPLWKIAIVGYTVGGVFANHLTAALHECCHFLVFRRPLYNKYFAMLINCPLGAPAAVSFRKYHLEHHSHLGVDDVDVDLPSSLESTYIVGTFIKLAFCIVYMFIYSLRPMIIKPKPVGKEDFINAFIVVTFDLTLLHFWGWKALAYLAISTSLGCGLHPLAGHLIAEHYMFTEGQETYSYYGPLNFLLYNVGYHNEHHDFPQIPGSRLWKLKQIAPEFYTGLEHHNSYLRVFWKFITDPTVGPWTRLRRKSNVGDLSVFMGPNAQHARTKEN